MITKNDFDNPFLLDLGKHHSKKLAVHVKHGDESFCMTVDEEFYDELCPLPEGYVYDYHSAIRLKMRNVEPHTDFPVNPIPENSEYVGSVFCPLNTNHPFIHLQVGEKCIKLGKGHWVMFDDRVLHSVIAEKVWSGVAVQVFRKHNAIRPL